MLKLASSFNEATYEISFSISGESKDDFNTAASTRHALCGILHQMTCILNQKPELALYVAMKLHDLCGLINKAMGGDNHDIY